MCQSIHNIFQRIFTKMGVSVRQIPGRICVFLTAISKSLSASICCSHTRGYVGGILLNSAVHIHKRSVQHAIASGLAILRLFLKTFC